MTIASEISRLQCAKADIKTAIENKGVEVDSNVTLDDYASCIDEIQQGSSGGNVGYVDMLVIGGGGAGGDGCGYTGGGGGAGGVILKSHAPIMGFNIPVDIGAGGTCCRRCNHQQSGNTVFGDYIAYGGGFGVYNDSGGTDYGKNSAKCLRAQGGSTGGQAGYYRCWAGCDSLVMKNGNLIIQGHSGKTYGTCCLYAGGGGGAGGDATYINYKTLGGEGIQTDISGTSQWYAGGGNGGAECNIAQTVCGGGGVGGGWYTDGGNATTCGSGGGGTGYGCCKGGNGAKGIVIVRYKTDGSCGICNAIGGSKYTCGNYTIHQFINNGNFRILDFLEDKSVDYTLVGGGGGGSTYGGGGGGAVCIGNISAKNGLSITIGSGGSGNNNGGDSCIVAGDKTIIAKGGCKGGTNCYGGDSGNGFSGGIACSICGGGGGGALGDGLVFACGTYGIGGRGRRGYGGGGGGYCVKGSYDGGGTGSGNATNCGGGGGATSKSGCPGIAKICYPSDGSYGFSNATGGTKSTVTEDGITYCVHTFTSNGTFTIVS